MTAASGWTPRRSERIGEFARYRDVDHDGIPYRTVPGDGMPAYFARGSGHNDEAEYSERADDYANNLDRLGHKFETAKTLVPKPKIEMAGGGIGLIAYGTTHWAVVESRDSAEGRRGAGYVVSAASRVSVHARGRRVHRSLRPCVRHRAESRRTDAVAAENGVYACAVCQASQHPPLRRAADRRPIRDDGGVGAGARRVTGGLSTV